MNRALATLPDISSATDFSASAAKAKLGEVIDLVAAGGLATITRRGRQRFAVLKLETVEALVAAAREQELESLGNRYDELVARMQSPEARAGVDALFTASGEEIGEGARAAADPATHECAAANAVTDEGLDERARIAANPATDKKIGERPRTAANPATRARTAMNLATDKGLGERARIAANAATGKGPGEPARIAGKGPGERARAATNLATRARGAAKSASPKSKNPAR